MSKQLELKDVPSFASSLKQAGKDWFKFPRVVLRGAKVSGSDLWDLTKEFVMCAGGLLWALTFSLVTWVFFPLFFLIRITYIRRNVRITNARIKAYNEQLKQQENKDAKH